MTWTATSASASRLGPQQAAGHAEAPVPEAPAAALVQPRHLPVKPHQHVQDLLRHAQVRRPGDTQRLRVRTVGRSLGLWYLALRDSVRPQPFFTRAGARKFTCASRRDRSASVKISRPTSNRSSAPCSTATPTLALGSAQMRVRDGKRVRGRLCGWFSRGEVRSAERQARGVYVGACGRVAGHARFSFAAWAYICP